MGKTFVIAGDSNNVGFDMDATTLPAGLETPGARVYVFEAGATYWGQMRPGVNTGTDANPHAWGPEAELGRLLGVAYPGEAVLIIDIGRGSTGLAQDPGAVDWSPRSDGEMFDLACDTIAAALRAYHEATGKPAPALDGVFWVGGPNDAYDAAKAHAYADNLTELFGAIRAEWMHDPQGRIVFSRAPDAGPYSLDVRVAQWAVDQADPYASSFKTIGYDMQADGVHYSAGGLVQLGQGLYDGWAL